MPHRAFFPNVRVRGGGAYGNAVLSRFPIAAARNIDLTYPGRKHRSAVYAALDVPGAHGGRPRAVHVFNLHLGLAGFERIWQLSRFFADHPFAGLAQRTPVIVGGDFNDVWGRLGADVFRARGFPRCRSAPPGPFRPGRRCAPSTRSTCAATCGCCTCSARTCGRRGSRRTTSPSTPSSSSSSPDTRNPASSPQLTYGHAEGTDRVRPNSSQGVVHLEVGMESPRESGIP